MKTFLVAAAVVASWLAVPARAHAAPPDAEGAASALVAEAARAYDQNQLDEALRLLARAYELSPRPSILFNQAQVFRAKNDCAAALDAYQRFIDTTTPADPNRERALQRRTEMQACAEPRKPTAPPEAPPAEPPTASPTATTAPAPVQLTIADPAPVAPPVAVTTQTATSPADDAGRGRHRAMRISGWTLVGVGVVAAGASAVLAWQAHNIQEELNSEINEPSVSPMEWSGGRQSRVDEGSRDAALARWFGVAAAVAGGGGAALLIVSRPPPATGSAAGGAASHAATALIGWSGTF